MQNRTNVYLLLSGIVSVLAGTLLIAGWTLNLHRDSLPGALLVLPGYILSMLAFTAIAYFHGNRLSIFGISGFAIIIIAHALFIPWPFLDIARISGVITGADWYYVERNGPTGIIAITGGFTFVSGYLLFATDMIRTKVMSRWPAYLLLLAAVQPFIFPLIGVGKLLPRIAGLALVLFGIQFLRIRRKNIRNS
jgi:hypothetical protein